MVDLSIDNELERSTIFYSWVVIHDISTGPCSSSQTVNVYQLTNWIVPRIVSGDQMVHPLPKNNLAF